MKLMGFLWAGALLFLVGCLGEGFESSGELKSQGSFLSDNRNQDDNHQEIDNPGSIIDEEPFEEPSDEIGNTDPLPEEDDIEGIGEIDAVGELLNARGYKARDCSFDLNGDLVKGGSGDCNICNAELVNNTIRARNQVSNREQIYVDCNNGEDRAGCGKEGAEPCKSINYVYEYYRDGKDDPNKANTICFTGLCKDVVRQKLPLPDIKDEFNKPKRGNEVFDFQYPKNPTILSGWDLNGNSVYPPADDNSVIDGNNGRDQYAFDLSGNANNHLELAHFKIQNYADANTDVYLDPDDKLRGLFRMTGGKSGRQSCSHRYIHDIEISKVNLDFNSDGSFSGTKTEDQRRVFNFMSSNCQHKYTAIENITCIDCGGYLMRGGWSTIDDEKGPVRVKNITYRGWGTSTSGPTGIKFWSAKNVEIINNIMDSGVSASMGKPGFNVNASASSSTAIFPSACVKNFYAINNEIRNFIRSFKVTTTNKSGCKTSSDNLVFKRNISTNDYAYKNNFGGPGHSCFYITPKQGKDQDWLQSQSAHYVEDLLFVGNVCSSNKGFLSCIFDTDANRYAAYPDPGTNKYINNTCHVSGGIHYGMITIGGFINIPSNGKNPDLDPENYNSRYIIKNNILSGGSSDELAISVYSRIKNRLRTWDVDSNVFFNGARFQWGDGNFLDASDWRARANSDKNSSFCSPKYQSVSGLDFHLKIGPDGDSCARNKGTSSVSQFFTLDIDREEYGFDGSWNVGADEN